MSENFSKSKLDAMRVADLRGIAKNYQIETDGLKKLELIDAILLADEDDKVADIKVEVTPVSFNNEVIDNTLEEIDNEQHISEVISAKDEVNDPRLVDGFMYVGSPVIVYKDESLTSALSRVAGKLVILATGETTYKVRAFVPGYGPVFGYVSK